MLFFYGFVKNSSSNFLNLFLSKSSESLENADFKAFELVLDIQFLISSSEETNENVTFPEIKSDILILRLIPCSNCFL